MIGNELTPPLRETPGFLLSLVAEAANRQFEAAIATLGLTRYEVGALEAAAAHPGIVQARLAETLGLFKPKVVPVVGGLVTRGLLHRSPHPQDRRALRIHITDPGAALLGRARAEGTALALRFLSPLGEEADSFVAQLGRLAAVHGEM